MGGDANGDPRDRVLSGLSSKVSWRAASKSSPEESKCRPGLEFGGDLSSAVSVRGARVMLPDWQGVCVENHETNMNSNIFYCDIDSALAKT